jgi:hypothetical protein
VHAANRVYQILNWHATRLRRELLTVAVRRGVPDKIARVVRASIQASPTGNLTVHLPCGIVLGG